MGIIEKTKAKIKACQTCGGNLHYRYPDGTAARCSCFYDNRFIRYFVKAGIDESLIDVEVAKNIKKDMGDKPLYTFLINNELQKRIWMHSAAYMAIKHHFQTRMYNDHDLGESVFDRVEVEEGKSSLSPFLLPEFLIFNIGNLRNKDYLAHHIRFVLEDRKIAHKKTLIFVPMLNAIKDRYDDVLLDDLLFKDKMMYKFVK